MKIQTLQHKEPTHFVTEVHAILAEPIIKLSTNNGVYIELTESEANELSMKLLWALQDLELQTNAEMASRETPLFD